MIYSIVMLEILSMTDLSKIINCGSFPPPLYPSDPTDLTDI